MRVAVAVSRLTMAAAIAVAVVVSATISVGHGTVSVFDFASYLTTTIACWVAASLTVSAVRLVVEARPSPFVDRMRFFAVVYAVVLVLGRGVLRSPWEPSAGYPIVTIDVFLVLGMFVATGVDWLFVNDHARTRLGHLAWLPAYPVLWCAIVVIRGVGTGWTPYPLLDPAANPGHLIATFTAVLVGTLAAGGYLILGERMVARVTHRTVTKFEEGGVIVDEESAS